MKGFLGKLVSKAAALIGMGKAAIAPEIRTLELPTLRRVKKGGERHRGQLRVEPLGSKLEKRFAEAYDRNARGY